jgi:general stress protein 26
MDKSTGKNLFDLVSEFDVAMLVTHGSRGIHARPMAIARLDVELCVTYFVTDINSIKVDEINANHHALVTFQGLGKYASVSGELTILQDRELIEGMWKEVWKVWFPNGKSDPNIAVLKFSAHEGEFWDNAGMQALKYVYSAAKAYLSGVRPEPDEGQHSKILI